MINEARLAQLLTPTTAALNVGSNDGISLGDNAKLVDWVAVTDPVTGEQLGKVSVPKLDLEVVQVQDRLCVVKVVSSYTSGNKQFRKRMTDDPDMADYKTVLVHPGMFVSMEAGVPF